MTSNGFFRERVRILIFVLVFKELADTPSLGAFVLVWLGLLSMVFALPNDSTQLTNCVDLVVDKNVTTFGIGGLVQNFALPCLLFVGALLLSLSCGFGDG